MTIHFEVVKANDDEENIINVSKTKLHPTSSRKSNSFLVGKCF